MITAVHALVFAEDAEAARAFFRDVVQFPYVDTGGGWLIFKTGPSELGVHPDRMDDGSGGETRTDQRSSVTFACDDLDATMAQWAARGAEFVDEPVQLDWGRLVHVKVPGAAPLELYQPAYDPPALLP